LSEQIAEEGGIVKWNKIGKFKSWEGNDYYITDVLDSMLAGFENFTWRKPYS